MEINSQNAKLSDWRLYVCGCRGSRPVYGERFREFGGQTSCFVLKNGNHAVIIDCGTGLHDAGPILADCTEIDILITHVHYDHVLGLLGGEALPKNARIRIFGDFMSWFGKVSLEDLYRPPFWPVEMQPGTPIQAETDGTVYPLNEQVSFRFIQVDHPNHCSMIALQAGAKRLCIFADCECMDNVPPELLADCDLMICDGMFNAVQQEAHVGWGHSSWEAACALARQHNPKVLLIAHHAPQNDDALLRSWEQEARKLYPHCTFARAGMTLKI